MDDIFKTPTGTVLPLLILKGKPYLQVAHRLVWFREEKPDWSIETQMKVQSPDVCIFMATIKDEAGRIIATAHKYEDRKGFPDFIEKGETGAIGRALALCGYGTQFCSDELDEGARLVDSPTPKASIPTVSPLRTRSQQGPDCPNGHGPTLVSKFNPEWYCPKCKHKFPMPEKKEQGDLPI